MSVHLDPNTPPVGRQPYQVRHTPSKPYPWYGSICGSTGNPKSDEAQANTYRVGGRRYTAEQVRALAERGLDAASVEAMPVRRQALDRELCYGARSLPPVFQFECPVLRRAKDIVYVIAPNGEEQPVRADGWVSAPRTRVRMGWW